jgi:putative DNA primase/helicase
VKEGVGRHSAILKAIDDAEDMEAIDASPKTKSNGAEGASSGSRRKKPVARDRLLSLFSDVDLFLDEAGEVYASIFMDDHRENYSLRSRQVRRAIAGKYFLQTGSCIGATAIDDVIQVLEFGAIKHSRTYPVFRRVGHLYGELIYLDLCDPKWRAVEISKSGWRITTEPPVKFVRDSNALPLPEPEPGAMIEELRAFTNVRNDDDFTLLLSFLLMCFRPDEPCPPLLVSGEQGSGKSNLCRIVRSLIDPHVALIRRPPKDERDLAAAISNNFMPVLDNVSSVPHWLSDAIAAAVTGAGFAARALYSDDEERVILAKPRMVLNGIPDLTGSADLADRSIFLNLPTIEATERKPERSFWEMFERARPKILGALCDAVSVGLSRIGTLQLDEFPRMADFCAWVEACAPGIGLEPGDFSRAFNTNRKKLVEMAIEADPVAMAVRDFMVDRIHPWEGTASELLDLLNSRVSAHNQKSKFWPSSSTAMGSRLRRAAPGLRDHHKIDVASKHSGSRVLRLSFLSDVKKHSEDKRSTGTES